jgi:hypothetical protein
VQAARIAGQKIGKAGIHPSRSLAGRAEKALSARLDPEELREVIGAYHRVVAEAVRRFRWIRRHMGDRVLVYFGDPRAREDDAERAMRAGLAVVSDLIGERAEQERVVGETPNLARTRRYDRGDRPPAAGRRKPASAADTPTACCGRPRPGSVARRTGRASELHHEASRQHNSFGLPDLVPVVIGHPLSTLSDA